MNFFVISDIHGSLKALEEVFRIYKQGDYRKLIICGDILYHGARNPLPNGYDPKGVISLLNEISQDIIAVRGNCESEVDSMVLDFPIKSDYSTILTEDYDIFITHGHLFSLDNIPKLRKDSLYLQGHTHIPVGEKFGDIHLLNPGSISLPKGGYKPSYGILSNNNWEVREIYNSNLILNYKF